MSEGSGYRSTPARRSASADAAALKWAEAHPEEDVALDPPAAPSRVPENDDGLRRSASAEAAALRYRDAESDQGG
jgi:hypothetical protein